jgi:cob(I)alamin adenosyltransferase
VDEAQAMLGMVRAFAGPGELEDLMIETARGLYIAMTELATLHDNRRKLTPGVTLVTPDMVSTVEEAIDRYSERFDLPHEFVIPGGNKVAALLDLARTAMRRAEREALAAVAEGSEIIRYLNRLSDLLWVLARWQEGESVMAKQTKESFDEDE